MLERRHPWLMVVDWFVWCLFVTAHFLPFVEIEISGEFHRLPLLSLLIGSAIELFSFYSPVEIVTSLAFFAAEITALLSPWLVKRFKRLSFLGAAFTFLALGMRLYTMRFEPGHVQLGTVVWLLSVIAISANLLLSAGFMNSCTDR